MKTSWPSRTHSRSVRRMLVDEFYARHVVMLPPGSRVLDVGGTKIAKRGRFNIERYDVHVIYANVSTVKCPDTQADAAALPFSNCCFDAIICAELLEHVSDPVIVLRECHRVLRNQGLLFISVPFLYHMHGDPYDFGRYTDHYWRQHLHTLGFGPITIEHQGLFFAVLADFLTQYLSHVGVRRPFGRLARWAGTQFQHWALHYEQQPTIHTNPFLRSFTTGFGIVAIRRSTNQ